MRVLVTGGTGTVGREAVKRLVDHGHDVTVIGRRPDIEIEGGHYQPCDINDYDAFRPLLDGIEGIVHLAAIPAPLHDPGRELFRVNCLGTFNVYEAAADAGIKRIVSASSINALGYFFGRERWELTYVPVDEEHPTYSTDAYSFSKQVIERIGDYFWRRDGITSTCLRLPGVYEAGGPRAERMNKMDPAPFIEAIREIARMPVDERLAFFAEQHRTMSEGMYSRSNRSERGRWPRPNPKMWAMMMSDNLFTSIDARDSAQAIEKSLLADIEGNHPLFVNDRYNGVGIPSADLARVFYPLAKVARPLEGYDSLVSIARARELIGFEPEYTRLDGLREMLGGKLPEITLD